MAHGSNERVAGSPGSSSQRALAGGVGRAVLVGDLGTRVGPAPGSAAPAPDGPSSRAPRSVSSGPPTLPGNGRPPRTCTQTASAAPRARRGAAGPGGVDPEVGGHPAVAPGPDRGAVADQIPVTEALDRRPPAPRSTRSRSRARTSRPPRPRVSEGDVRQAGSVQADDAFGLGEGPDLFGGRHRARVDDSKPSGSSARAARLRCRPGGCASCCPGRRRAGGGVGPDPPAGTASGARARSRAASAVRRRAVRAPRVPRPGDAGTSRRPGSGPPSAPAGRAGRTGSAWRGSPRTRRVRLRPGAAARASGGRR